MKDDEIVPRGKSQPHNYVPLAYNALFNPSPNQCDRFLFSPWVEFHMMWYCRLHYVTSHELGCIGLTAIYWGVGECIFASWLFGAWAIRHLSHWLFLSEISHPASPGSGRQLDALWTWQPVSFRRLLLGVPGEKSGSALAGLEQTHFSEDPWLGGRAANPAPQSTCCILCLGRCVCAPVRLLLWQRTRVPGVTHSSLSPGQGGGVGRPCLPGEFQTWLFHPLESQNHPHHHFLG